MAMLADLWMPILVSAVFVFLVSSVVHMLLPIHKGDLQPLPDEDAVLAAMRRTEIAPGEYMLPGAKTKKEMCSPEMRAKCEQGPVGTLIVRPRGVPSIGLALAQWFAFSLLISVFVAYVASLSLVPGEEYMRVFRLTGTVAVLGYAFSTWPESIWKGVPWSTSAKFTFDGVLYGLTTAGVFGWLWPGV